MPPTLPQRKRLCAFAALAVAASLLAACAPEYSGRAAPRAEGGVLDLSDWNFEKDGPVHLSGQWEFYWKQFLTAEELEEGKGRLTGFAIVPSRFQEFEMEARPLPGVGFATFRLRVLLPKSLDRLALRIENQGTAYEMDAGEKQIASQGVAGTTADVTEGDRRILLADLPQGAEQVLVARIANYQHARGGFWATPVIGTRVQIEVIHRSKLGLDLFLTGAILIMGLYHLGLFLSRRQEPTALWFALFCFVIVLRVGVVTSYVVQSAFPDVPYALYLRLEYLTFYAGVPIFALFLASIFPFELRKWLLRLILIPGLGCSLAVMVLPSLWFTATLPYYQVFTLLFCGLVGAILILALIRRRPSAAIIFVGVFALILAAVLDIMNNRFRIDRHHAFAAGMFVFIFAQAAALSKRFATAFNVAEDLSQNLEKKISERTVELQAARDEADRARLEIQRLSEFAKKINETTDLDEILASVSGYLKDEFGIEATMLGLVYDQELRFFRSNMPESLTEEQIALTISGVVPLDERGGVLYRTYKRKRPFYLADASFKIETTSGQTITFIETLDIKSFLLTPLVVQGETIAILGCTSFAHHLKLSKADIASISRFCDQIAGAIHGSHLYHEAEISRAAAEIEKQKSDSLLLNILPAKVADELKEKGAVEPLYYESVSVLFTDFVGFTKVAESMPPDELIQELDGCFTYFDDVAARHGLEKLKTIGDAYMCAGGLPEINHTHAVDACLAALEFQAFMNQMRMIKSEMDLPYWELRLGIHSGPVTAGVVGKNKFAYDIWGDTVNTASRCESSGVAGRVNISEDSYRLVSDFFECEYRGKVTTKGKGDIDMYFVNRIRPALSEDDEGQVPNAQFRAMYSRLREGQRGSAGPAEPSIEGELLIKRRDKGSVAVLDLSGRLDRKSANALRAILAEFAAGDSAAVILNMGKVQSIDSTGLGTLIQGDRSLRNLGGTFALVNIPESTRFRFDASGLAERIQIYHSEQTAIEALQGKTQDR